MRVFLLLLVCCVSAPALPQSAASPGSPDDANQLFRAGRFHEAATAYRALIEKTPSSAAARSGLIQSLLKLDDVQAADDESSRALQVAPQSALIHAARGDVLFRKGLMPAAEAEYRSALRLDDKCARGWLGLGKIEAMVSHPGHAREAFTRAHELDAEDGDAFYRWAVLLPYPQNVAALEKHRTEFHADPERERREREYIAFLKAVAGRKIWVPAAAISQAEIKIENIASATAIRGAGLRARFNNGPTQTLLLDTGAAWITIPRRLAEKAGARKLSDLGMEGTGDSGPAAAFFAWVDKITIGDIEFHDCVVQVSIQDIAGPEDGTIGLQMLTDHLVTLDFPAHRVRIGPLPDAVERAADDPAKPLVHADSAPHTMGFFGFGHLLLISTRVNERAEGLFLLDTGANSNSITPELARQVVRLRSSKAAVRGNSGEVREVFVAPEIALEFGGFKTPREDMVAFDRRALSKNLETEISGFIGLPALSRSKVTINYRDGVVRIE